MACMGRPRATVLTLALVAGCIDEPSDDSGGMCHGDLGTFATDGLIEWYAFGHDFGEFCSAGFGIAEDHARWVAQAWGTEPKPFDYGLFESRDEPCWPCADVLEACVLGGGSTAAEKAPHRHEIVHAVRPGFCFPLIEEGWAMLYGDHFVDASTDGDIRAALAQSNPWLPGEHYPLAARFVAFLVETRGVPKLRELCDLDADDRIEFEGAVLDTYGVTFDALATEFDAYPAWTLGELRQDQACESADVLVGPTSWDFNFECGAPAIEGKMGWYFDTQRLVELPSQDYPYMITFEAPMDLELRYELRSCAREGMASTSYALEFVNLQAHVPQEFIYAVNPLSPGVYVVRVRIMESTEPVDLHVSVGSWP